MVTQVRVDAAPSVRSWVGRGVLAVTDQALFSASGLVLNILLARWLEPDDYGAFAVGFTVFIALSTLHTALITEPMLVLGSGRYAGHLAEYRRALVVCHWRVAGVVALALAGAGLGVRVAGGERLALVLLEYAVVAPVILLFWMLRRAAYVRLDPQTAGIGAAINLLIVLAGVVGLRAAGRPSALGGVAAMGAGALLASLWFARRLAASELGSADVPIADVWRAHWAYGRWAIGSTALVAIPANLFLPVLSASHGLGAAALLRAIVNFVQPAVQATNVLGVLLLSGLVRARGTADFGRLVRRALGILVGACSLYGLVLVAVADPLLAMAYSGRYRSEPCLIWLVGALPVVVALEYVPSVVLKAVERVDSVFWIWLLVAVTIAPLGVVGTVVLGECGAAAAMVGTLLGAALLLGIRSRAAGQHPHVPVVEART